MSAPTETEQHGGSEGVVTAALQTMADQYAAKAAETASFWRQVPFLALLDGASDAGYEDEADIHYNAKVSNNGLYRIGQTSGWGSGETYIECLTGKILTEEQVGSAELLPSTATHIVTAASSSLFRLHAWSGEAVARTYLSWLRDEAGTPDFLQSECHSTMMERIHQMGVGLLLGGGDPNGKLKTVDENLFGLANGWSGTFDELVRAAVRLADAEDDPDIRSLLIMQEY